MNVRNALEGGQKVGTKKLVADERKNRKRLFGNPTAQTAARYDEELRQDYQGLKFRRGTAVAKVAVARELAVRLY